MATMTSISEPMVTLPDSETVDAADADGALFIKNMDTYNGSISATLVSPLT